MTQASCLATAGQAAALLIYAGDVFVGASGANKLFNKTFANLLIQVDAFAMEPIVAVFTANHPSVVVWSPTQTIRPVV